MTKFGRVTAYNEQTHTATIEYERPDACAECGACGSLSHRGRIALRADCNLGDWVRLEFPESRFIQATALVYGLPLLGLLAGLFLGQWLGKSEGGAVLGALLGLALSCAPLALHDRRVQNRADSTVRVAAVYPEKPTQEAMGCQENLT